MYSSNQRKLYRSRDGVMFGVCQGFAEWRELPVAPVRFLFILIALFTAVVPCLLIYFGLAMFLPLEPKRRDRDDRNESGRPNDDDGKSRRGKDKEKDWDQRFYDGHK